MKIGLLAYHAACNFGAFLQLLSTVEYIKKQGDEPHVINWIPNDFRKDYEKRSLIEVRELYTRLQREYYPLTELCLTAREVAVVIEREKIDAVIIGTIRLESAFIFLAGVFSIFPILLAIACILTVFGVSFYRILNTLFLLL